MTQPDELKQAYDRAMAHNAMLREALRNNGCSCEDGDLHYCKNCSKTIKALNATEADATAWREALSMESFKRGAASAATAHYEQLATVTAERDALREELEAIQEKTYMDNLRELKNDPSLLKARLRTVWEMATIALAQSPPSE